MADEQNKIRHGAFTFEPTDRGVVVERELSAYQVEHLFTWPWSVFEKIVAAKPKPEK